MNNWKDAFLTAMAVGGGISLGILLSVWLSPIILEFILK